ncbi:MAG TPA: FapA family protein, partial [Patescibacteria group bacterium]|nr:FapA family protein [Patescibacteria group bacterium]
PKELEDGRVDFKNLDMFIQVDQGDLLLEKIPASAGRPGIDVLGQRLMPKHGQDVRLPLGKNVQLVDCSKMISSIAGQVLVEDRRVSVIPVIEVNGDVDLSTGNIDFVGNVIIRGSVQAGFSVKAGGDVEIYGTVSGSVVEGKDVIIRMGIIGAQTGYVSAVQDLQAKFIQNATASAGRDILVRDGIINSKVSAGRNVRVEGGNGSVVGGMVSAGEEIYARTVGTSLSTGTELRVGVNPLLREEYQHLRQEFKKVEANLEAVRKNLRLLQSQDRNHLSTEKKELMLKLTQGQFHMMGQAETLQRRINEIDLAFESMRFGRIKIHDRVAAGTKIIIGSLIKPLRDDFNYVKFYEADGEIRVTSIA